TRDGRSDPCRRARNRARFGLFASCPSRWVQIPKVAHRVALDVICGATTLRRAAELVSQPHSGGRTQNHLMAAETFIPNAKPLIVEDAIQREISLPIGHYAHPRDPSGRTALCGREILGVPTGDIPCEVCLDCQTLR